MYIYHTLINALIHFPSVSIGQGRLQFHDCRGTVCLQTGLQRLGDDKLDCGKW